LADTIGQLVNQTSFQFSGTVVELLVVMNFLLEPSDILIPAGLTVGQPTDESAQNCLGLIKPLPFTNKASACAGVRNG
jgi:hypothetical protein